MGNDEGIRACMTACTSVYRCLSMHMIGDIICTTIYNVIEISDLSIYDIFLCYISHVGVLSMFSLTPGSRTTS